MKLITRFSCKHVRLRKVYVRSWMLHARTENQYQTFPPRDNFPEIYIPQTQDNWRQFSVSRRENFEGTKTLTPSEFNAS